MVSPQTVFTNMICMIMFVGFCILFCFDFTNCRCPHSETRTYVHALKGAQSAYMNQWVIFLWSWVRAPSVCDIMCINLYNLFASLNSRRHLEYLDTSPNYDFLAYRQAVHECTEEFSRISKRIITIEEQFQGEFKNVEIARLIKNVQENEQRRLELVREEGTQGKKG